MQLEQGTQVSTRRIGRRRGVGPHNPLVGRVFDCRRGLACCEQSDYGPHGTLVATRSMENERWTLVYVAWQVSAMTYRYLAPMLTCPPSTDFDASAHETGSLRAHVSEVRPCH